jgi:hypothetical protein
MSVIKVNNITNRDGTSGPVIAGITTVSTTSHMVVPTGNTGQKVALALDPYINNLVLALPFNSESVFDDVSPKSKGTPAVQGSFGSSTSSLPFGITGVTTTSSGIVTFSKYYGTSCYFDGVGDHLKFAGSGDFQYAANDFTIEFWWYPTNTTRQALYHGSFGADYSIGIDYNSIGTNKLGIWASSNGSSWNLINADGGGNGICNTTVPQNQWNHIAYVRNGTTWRLYLNGIVDCTVSNLSGSVDITATDVQAIGAWWNSETAMSDLYGYLQDFRIYNGVAKYTSNFTPPTQIAL